ncbi:MAG: hypothetical protein WCV58_04225 [Patescibacteria group bacterium]|jgi:hypothetical protein
MEISPAKAREMVLAGKSIKGAIITGNLYLSGTKIGNLDLSYAIIEGSLNLKDAIVSFDVELESITIKGNLDLTDAAIEGYLNLRNAIVKDGLNLITKKGPYCIYIEPERATAVHHANPRIPILSSGGLAQLPK